MRGEKKESNLAVGCDLLRIKCVIVGSSGKGNNWCIKVKLFCNFKTNLLDLLCWTDTILQTGKILGYVQSINSKNIIKNYIVEL